METIQGSIARVIWPRGEDSADFKIVEFRIKGGDKIVAKGHIPSGDKDDSIELTGDWVLDTNYGRQFKVVAADRLIPATASGLAKFLAREVAGIGPTRAKQIVERFGQQTLEVLSKTPERLCEIKKVSKAMAEKIGQAWKAVADSSCKASRIWLAGRGFSPSASDKLLKKFGADTVNILTDYPFRAMEIPGIGFKMADSMASKAGHPADSPERLIAGIVHTAQKACEEKGNSCIWEEDLLKAARDLTGVVEMTESIGKTVENDLLIREESSKIHRPGPVYYLPRIHQAENSVVRKLTYLVGQDGISSGLPTEDRLKAVEEAESSLGKELTQEQRSAVIKALTRKVSIITGPPGVGKSESTSVLVRAAELLGISYALAAPTGRAAKRLAEATARPASTIHRLLEYEPKSNYYARNASRPLDVSLLLIDEASMVDIELASRLLDALPDESSIVLIGDADQLPSVGPGTLLRDLIDSKCLPVTTLQTIFRQARGSDIIRNAHQIRVGKIPTFQPKGVETDCFFMDARGSDAGYIKEALKKLCLESIPRKTGLDPVRDVQILIPMKAGPAGTREINAFLQGVLNDNPQVRGSKFKPGDRVMQHRNNYDLEVFNGDTGFIVGRDNDSGGLVVDFDGREVVCIGSDQEDLQLSYAITVHKSQGNQFPAVVVVLLNKHYPMLNRNLLYTAASRAQRLCVYLATKQSLTIATKTEDANSRLSMLADKIRGSFQERSNAIAP